MSELFKQIAQDPREYTPEEHQASLKRLAQAWGLSQIGAGYTIAAHEMYEQSALQKVLGDEDPEQLEKLMVNLQKLTELLA